MQLHNKVALVIGASTQGGIGEAIVQAFAREGAYVIASARREPEARAIAAVVGGEAIACDITNEDQVEAAIKYAKSLRDRLDCVVIVAGAHASQLVDDITRETLLRNFELNVIGPAFTIKHAARVMNRGGSISYISSAAAALSTVGVSAYGCTKAAGERLVEVAALENAPRGIRINTIQPGMLDTPMSSAALQRPGFRRAFERETPLGRLASVTEVAAAAVWLASDSCFSTGDRIRVAGGVHLRRHPTPEDFLK
jgi:NAD(P)-dependent dehydrogenase (short-subunit alcohol dehydrogenase family)